MIYGKWNFAFNPTHHCLLSYITVNQSWQCIAGGVISVLALQTVSTTVTHKDGGGALNGNDINYPLYLMLNYWML